MFSTFFSLFQNGSNLVESFLNIIRSYAETPGIFDFKKDQLMARRVMFLLFCIMKSPQLLPIWIRLWFEELHHCKIMRKNWVCSNMKNAVSYHLIFIYVIVKFHLVLLSPDSFCCKNKKGFVHKVVSMLR